MRRKAYDPSRPAGQSPAAKHPPELPAASVPHRLQPFDFSRAKQRRLGCRGEVQRGVGEGDERHAVRQQPITVASRAQPPRCIEERVVRDIQLSFPSTGKREHGGHIGGLPVMDCRGDFDAHGLALRQQVESRL